MAGEIFAGIPAKKEPLVNVILNAILQRFPHGRMWGGKNLIAIERGFAREFFRLRKNLDEPLNTYLEFWKIQAQNGENPQTLAFIEEKIRKIAPSACVFYSTGKREYILTRPRPASIFGASRFGANKPCVEQLGEQMGANAPFGKSYVWGEQTDGTYIDYVLDDAANSETARAVMDGVKIYNRNTNRFFYYVGGGETFFAPLKISENDLLELKKILVKIVTFGMFGIIHYEAI